MFYKIEECIGRGFYIVWDGIYETRESAEDEIIRRGARVGHGLETTGAGHKPALSSNDHE